MVEGSKILRERDVCKITDGRIQPGGGRKKHLVTLLAQLDEAGFSRDDLKTLQQLINAEKSDLYDVLDD
ncbi:MAG: hypothetical protein PHO37_13685 [Kiritimatiellae bacterium]|nr:hypothetical protein [Kiritimatiellia bacterium]